MATFFRLLLGYMWDCFRSHERLKAEILILRHQLTFCTERLRKGCGFPAVIGRCSSGCIGVSPISATPRRSCVPRQSFAGTGWVFAPGGAGDLTIQVACPELIKNPESSCAVCARKIRFGARRGFTASCSSLALMSPSRQFRNNVETARPPVWCWPMPPSTARCTTHIT